MPRNRGDAPVISGKTLPVEAAGISRQGRRPSNEDFALWKVPSEGSFAAYAIVCDGMGGHNAGEVASEMAASYFERNFEDLLQANENWESVAPEDLQLRVEKWVEEINHQIREQGDQNLQQRGMGTTLAIATILPPGRLLAANIGDSRIFLVRSGTVQQISVDHTALAEHRRILNLEKSSRFDMSASPFAHALTRSLGQEGRVLPDVADAPLAEGDVVILTSDGVTDVLEPETFIAVLAETYSLDDAVERTYQLAFDAGSRDNITVVMLGYGRTARKPAPPEAAPGVERTQELEDEKAKEAGAAGSSLLRGWLIPVLAVALAAGAAGLFLLKGQKAETSKASRSTPAPKIEAPQAPSPTAGPAAEPRATEVTEGTKLKEPLPSETVPIPAPKQTPTGMAQTAKVRPGNAPPELRAVNPPALRTVIPAQKQSAPEPAPTKETLKKPLAAPTVTAPVLHSTPVEAVSPQEARLEAVRIFVDHRNGNYVFHFAFDQPVRSPDAAGIHIHEMRLEEGDGGGGALRGGPYELVYTSLEGRILKFRLPISSTEFQGQQVLRPGQKVLISWDSENRPFPKAQETMTAQVLE